MLTLERSEELAAIDAAIESAASGRGGTILIEGPPGIGKTRLLREGAASAAADFEVLRARGDLLERELPFGIVRQLFEARLAAASGRRREALLEGAAKLAEPVLGTMIEPPAEPAPDRGLTVNHGLYWLAANLSDQGAVALVIDDIHWADVPSLQWLGYLARRLDGMSLLVLAATRPVDGELAGLVQALVAGQAERLLTPQPLSDEGVGRLVTELTDSDPDDAFVEACSRASGGNPFLLRELLRAATQQGVPPSQASAETVSALAPETVTRAILVRLESLPEESGKLARAVAVLGRDVPLDAAGELAELDTEEAAEAADALAGAYLLGPDRLLNFVHPIVRTAIEDEMPPSRRRRAHARAAAILGRRGEDPERRAAHLLVADPAGSIEAVETLRASARRATGRGAARIAVVYLVRALEEPPGPELRPAVLEELGLAAASAADPRSEQWLREAYAAAAEPASRGRCALALGRAMFFAGRPEEAFFAIDEAEADLGESERPIAARLEAELIAAARLDHGLRPRVSERLERLERLSEGDELAGSLLLAQRAYELALAGDPAERPAEMASEALGSGELLAALGPEDPSVLAAVNALALCERLDEAIAAFDAIVEAAGERGSALGFAMASCFRSQAHYRRGDIVASEADAHAAVEVAAAEGWGLGIPAARAFLVYALLERGLLDGAERVLTEAELSEEIPDLVMFDPLLESRGRLRIARGDVAGGISDLLACGERQQRWGAQNPSVIPWRSMTAEAMLSLDRVERARELADEEVELAQRAATPRALGMALRVAGMVHRDAELLERAVAVLERGPSPLELARARLALGALLRRSGRRSDAREQLRAALDAADRLRAEPLAVEAREELLASGARPRRPRLSGRDALTASELRVASRAAGGMSNREIAQSLFVTVKTVETHLRNAYRKLEIGSRKELPDALETQEALEPSAADG